MSAKHTWVVLAGGKGTRSTNPNLPKCLQEVRTGTTVLQLALSCIQDVQADVILVLNHGADMVIREAERLSPLFSNLQIRWVNDSGRGPVSALLDVKGHINTDFVGVILGDTVIQAPLNDYFAEFRSNKDKGSSCAIIARQSRHLFDSDKVTIDLNGGLTSFAGKGVEPNTKLGSTWGISGVSFFRASELSRLDHEKPDIARAVFAAFSLDEILAIRTSEYFRDSGTPGRLDEIRADFDGQLSSGKPSWPIRHPAIFVDRDGTLIPDVPKGRKTLLPSELFVPAIEFMAKAKRSGYRLFLVTNQPGVAKGQIGLADVYSVHNDLQEMLVELKAEFDDFEFCPHHPESGFEGEVPAMKIRCECRKPRTGMVRAIEARHRLSLSDSVVLGDSERDSHLAKKLGIEFVDVQQLVRSDGSFEW